MELTNVAQEFEDLCGRQICLGVKWICGQRQMDKPAPELDHSRAFIEENYSSQLLPTTVRYQFSSPTDIPCSYSELVTAYNFIVSSCSYCFPPPP